MVLEKEVVRQAEICLTGSLIAETSGAQLDLVQLAHLLYLGIMNCLILLLVDAYFGIADHGSVIAKQIEINNRSLILRFAEVSVTTVDAGNCRAVVVTATCEVGEGRIGQAVRASLDLLHAAYSRTNHLTLRYRNARGLQIHASTLQSRRNSPCRPRICS